eukprot:Hpha_TRINITY_DN26676_c0_g1::TRINITY_DN26676_c0_g1_i1::g.86118::m.86118
MFFAHEASLKKQVHPRSTSASPTPCPNLPSAAVRGAALRRSVLSSRNSLRRLARVSTMNSLRPSVSTLSTLVRASVATSVIWSHTSCTSTAVPDTSFISPRSEGAGCGSTATAALILRWRSAQEPAKVPIPSARPLMTLTSAGGTSRPGSIVPRSDASSSANLEWTSRKHWRLSLVSFDSGTPPDGDKVRRRVAGCCGGGLAPVEALLVPPVFAIGRRVDAGGVLLLELVVVLEARSVPRRPTAGGGTFIPDAITYSDHPPTHPSFSPDSQPQWTGTPLDQSYAPLSLPSPAFQRTNNNK